MGTKQFSLCNRVLLGGAQTKAGAFLPFWFMRRKPVLCQPPAKLDGKELGKDGEDKVQETEARRTAE